MTTRQLPSEATMLEAFLERDPTFDGVFVTGVRTTGIFCRTTCSARKPRPENVSFFESTQAALHAGYRPCMRCRPLERRGETPDWLRPLLSDIEADPARRWTDHDVRSRGLSPERVRRWFKNNHGMTFQAYSRARRLGAALGHVKDGTTVGRAAFEAGYDSLSGFQDAFRHYFGDAPTRLEGQTVVHVDRIPTPLGLMLVAVTDDAVCMLEFVDRRALPNQVKRVRKRLSAVFVPGSNAVTESIRNEIDAYFAGTLKRFETPVLQCGTDFQKDVWQALLEVPYGRTASYSDIAGAVNRAGAVRAVGTANGANALAIVIPCHRIVGVDGKLTGYGGGLWRKQRLLDLEVEHGQKP